MQSSLAYADNRKKKVILFLVATFGSKIESLYQLFLYVGIFQH